MMRCMKSVLRLGVLALVLFAASGVYADNRSAWTKDQLQTMCYGRAQGSDARYQRCMKDNAHRAGRPKQAGEASELNRIDPALAKKAEKRTSTNPK